MRGGSYDGGGEAIRLRRQSLSTGGEAIAGGGNRFRRGGGYPRK